MTTILIHIVRKEHRAFRYEEEISKAFPDVKILMSNTNDQAIELVGEADVLISYSSLINQSVLEKGEKLKWIHALTTGMDWMDRVTLRDDLIVTSTTGMHGPAMAEMALLLMMSLTRGMHRFVRAQDAGEWDRYPGGLLHDRIAGIIGLGTTAEHLAPICKAMGMRVIGFSESDREVPGVDQVYRRRELMDHIGDIDHLVVLAPYTPETHHMINADVLSAMKPTSFLVNIARGGLVDQAALMEAMRERKIAGAGLDVYEVEPLPSDHPLRTLENVITTPHNAGLFDAYPDMAMVIVAKNLRCYLADDNEEMINVVNH